MRYLMALVSAAPLALLAACGASDEPAPEATETVAAQPTMPPVPADALETLDYAGTYTLTKINGSKSSVALDPEAGTYSYTSPKGETTEGSFKKIDGNKIELEDFDGAPAYFAVADGAIYQLSDADESVEDVIISNMYRRDEAEGTAEADASAPEGDAAAADQTAG